ncbi:MULTISPECIES: methylamine utilization protein [unclassified Caulobacter]|uniref:methylamine utilization protein n=1 Tax=unclassified Caulobacter TaxID=2648921 RepID=UPI000D3AE92A|nr:MULTISPECIES: methylamine utilization protein [unclassified Caulobacter]PTS91203.1 methylamine utilization protein [Caulobacter sp. HMWF009]PTT10211.1 methylamine utilization protein [Caulobacter sp. HMWF025]
MRFIATLLLIVFFSSKALAGTLSVTVRSTDGKPVQDAVVMVYPGGQPTRGPITFPWPYRVAQQNIQFTPFVLIVPVGAEVAFPNLDKVRHHVYSFSAGNKFELKLYGREENRTVRLPTAGVAAIGCNIHDQMVGFIRVVDTAYAAKTDAAGVATISDVPSGSVVARVWHPYLRAMKNEKTLATTSVGNGTTRETMAVELRPQGGH